MQRRGHTLTSKFRVAVLTCAGLVGLLGNWSCAERLDFFPKSVSPDGTAGAGPIPGVPSPPEPSALQVTGVFNLSRDNSASRKCSDGGDGVQYSVAAVEGESATLALEPGAGCLGPGDEVLLVALQGNASSTANIGNYELLRVNSLSGRKVNFVSGSVGAYGASEGENDSVSARSVTLVRVPSYSRLIVATGGILEADSFDGKRGGVLALRSLGDLVVEGAIEMSARGYRGGSATIEVEQTGTSGESLGGLGRREVTPNYGGGGGGLGDQTTNACVQDGNAGGGGGHVAAGSTASVFDLCSGVGVGQGGLSYAQLGKLFLGSGGGAGGTDNVLVDNPPGGRGGAGGGIIWLLAQTLSGSGRIASEGEDGAGDAPDVECVSGGSTVSCYDHSGPGGGGAGGSIRISAKLQAGVQLSALGGRGGNGADQATGNAGDGSEGLVLVD